MNQVQELHHWRNRYDAVVDVEIEKIDAEKLRHGGARIATVKVNEQAERSRHALKACLDELDCLLEGGSS